MLLILVGLPLFGIIINNFIIPLLFNNNNKNKYIGVFSMITTIIVLYISLYLFLTMNNNSNEFQYREIIDLYYIRMSLGLDGVGLSVILIITLIFPILILLSKNESNIKEGYDYNSIKNYKNLINILLIMEAILILIFISLDIFLFFIMFEFILIPMFLIIGKYGSRVNKIEAAYRFIIYTMIGSLVMLISIIILYLKFGTTNLEILNIKILELYDSNQLILLKILWIFIFFSFMIKIPMFPFHTWLPEAHTEAPTIGSIILAAILLKLGTFGIYRFSIYLFNTPSYLYIFNNRKFENIYNYFIPIIFILSLLSIFYCSFIAIQSTDLKKIIAYSSIVHMNFSIFGFFSGDILGFTGSTFLMFSHAFVSGALFLLIGILYKRYHTRILFYFKGLVFTMPLFSSFFLFFSLANISLPFTSSFIAEIFIILSTFKINLFLTLILTLSLIFSSCYVMFLANRILFSSLSSSIYIPFYLDLSFNEFICLFPMFFFTIFLGIYPKPLLDLFNLNLINILF
jgi:proton-translocating NADH-quinone oxidoreductase chain M